jgi:hypothetical protein
MEHLTDEQLSLIKEYAILRYEFVENLGNPFVRRQNIASVTERMGAAGIIITSRDSIVGVRVHVGNWSAMFEWDNWNKKVYFFRERIDDM